MGLRDFTNLQESGRALGSLTRMPELLFPHLLPSSPAQTGEQPLGETPAVLQGSAHVAVLTGAAAAAVGKPSQAHSLSRTACS